MQISKGGSSLLFIISFIKSLYGGEQLFYYKISHVFLIIASFVCNASEFQSTYVQFDYASIFLICISHLNNAAINSALGIYLVYEYSYHRSIENAKNMAFGMSVATSIYKGYYYLDNVHYYTLVISSGVGVVIYKIRYDICKHPNTFSKSVDNSTKIIWLTTLFHVCIMNILYVSCLTFGK